MILRRVTSLKDEKGDFITDSHRFLARWRNHFFVFEIETAIEKLKRHKSPGTDQIPIGLIKEGGRKIRYDIHKIINSIWNKEELPDESIIVPIYKKEDKTDCSNCRGISVLPTTYKILSDILPSRLIPSAEAFIGDH